MGRIGAVQLVDVVRADFRVVVAGVLIDKA